MAMTAPGLGAKGLGRLGRGLILPSGLGGHGSGSKARRLEGSKARRLEGSKVRRFEGSKVRRFEGSKARRLEGSSGRVPAQVQATTGSAGSGTSGNRPRRSPVNGRRAKSSEVQPGPAT